MTKHQKHWYNSGYVDAESFDHPEAHCQEMWGNMLPILDKIEIDFPTFYNYFHFYKQGAIKAHEEKHLL